MPRAEKQIEAMIVVTIGGKEVGRTVAYIPPLKLTPHNEINADNMANNLVKLSVQRAIGGIQYNVAPDMLKGE